MMDFIKYTILAVALVVGIISIHTQWKDGQAKIACREKGGIYSDFKCFTKTKEIPL